MAAIDPGRPDALLLRDDEVISFVGVTDAALGAVHRATIAEKWRIEEGLRKMASQPHICPVCGHNEKIFWANTMGLRERLEKGLAAVRDEAADRGLALPELHVEGVPVRAGAPGPRLVAAVPVERRAVPHTMVSRRPLEEGVAPVYSSGLRPAQAGDLQSISAEGDVVNHTGLGQRLAGLKEEIVGALSARGLDFGPLDGGCLSTAKAIKAWTDAAGADAEIVSVGRADMVDHAAVELRLPSLPAMYLDADGLASAGDIMRKMIRLEGLESAQVQSFDEKEAETHGVIDYRETGIVEDIGRILTRRLGPATAHLAGARGEISFSVGSPAFDAWFAGSKVVDDEGRPRAVYHGTRRDFEAFLHQDDAAASHRPQGAGFFFTESPESASWYAGVGGGAEGARVLPVYLDLRNPLVIDYQGTEDNGEVEADITRAQEAGHDGLILRNIDDGSVETQYVAFEPSQIKSVFNHDWDAGSARFSAPPLDGPTFGGRGGGRFGYPSDPGNPRLLPNPIMEAFDAFPEKALSHLDEDDRKAVAQRLGVPLARHRNRTVEMSRLMAAPLGDLRDAYGVVTGGDLNEALAYATASPDELRSAANFFIHAFPERAVAALEPEDRDAILKGRPLMRDGGDLPDPHVAMDYVDQVAGMPPELIHVDLARLRHAGMDQQGRAAWQMAPAEAAHNAGVRLGIEAPELYARPLVDAWPMMLRQAGRTLPEEDVPVALRRLYAPDTVRAWEWTPAQFEGRQRRVAGRIPGMFELTEGERARVYGNHEEAVARAVSLHLPVPDDVLAAYPGIHQRAERILDAAMERRRRDQGLPHPEIETETARAQRRGGSAAQLPLFSITPAEPATRADQDDALIRIGVFEKRKPPVFHEQDWMPAAEYRKQYPDGFKRDVHAFAAEAEEDYSFGAPEIEVVNEFLYTDPDMLAIREALAREVVTEHNCHENYLTAAGELDVGAIEIDFELHFIDEFPERAAGPLYDKFVGPGSPWPEGHQAVLRQTGRDGYSSAYDIAQDLNRETIVGLVMPELLAREVLVDDTDQYRIYRDPAEDAEDKVHLSVPEAWRLVEVEGRYGRTAVQEALALAHEHAVTGAIFDDGEVARITNKDGPDKGEGWARRDMIYYRHAGQGLSSPGHVSGAFGILRRRAFNAPPGWQVVHLRTGVTVDPAFGRREHARDYATALNSQAVWHGLEPSDLGEMTQDHLDELAAEAGRALHRVRSDIRQVARAGAEARLARASRDGAALFGGATAQFSTGTDTLIQAPDISPAALSAMTRRADFDAAAEDPAFREWFEDSKVVDAAGAPLVVYHGTPTRPSESNSADVRAEAEDDKDYPPFDLFRTQGHGLGITDSMWLGEGAYFTPDPDFAFEFGNFIIPAYVALKNPFVIVDDSSNGRANTLRFLQSLQSLDGLPDRFRLDLSLPEDETFVTSLGDAYHTTYALTESLDEDGRPCWALISGETAKTDGTGAVETTGATPEEAVFRHRYRDDFRGFLLHVVKDIGNSEFRRLLERNGYDGVIEYREFNAGIDPEPSEVVAFRPNQIKSIWDKAFDAADARFLAPESESERERRFQRWFAGSHVTTNAGAPKTVFHGTPDGRFEAFGPAAQGRHAGTSTGAFHFTDDPGQAESFSAAIDAVMFGKFEEMFGREPGAIDLPPASVIMPVHLAMKNPTYARRGTVDAGRVAEARAAGYDGIIASPEDWKGPKEYIVFEPTQIKSIWNDTWDVSDPRISFSAPDLFGGVDRRRLLPETIRGIEQWGEEHPLNPKVARLVAALNLAGIPTSGSGDLYGDELIYVDLGRRLPAQAQARLPEGWVATTFDITATARDALGRAAPKEKEALLRNIEAAWGRGRIARAGAAPVSDADIRGVLEALGGREAASVMDKVRFALGDGVSAPLAGHFHSALRERLAAHPQDAALADHWVDIVHGLPGVKREEIEFSGLIEHLMERNGETLRRSALVSWLDARPLPLMVTVNIDRENAGEVIVFDEDEYEEPRDDDDLRMDALEIVDRFHASAFDELGPDASDGEIHDRALTLAMTEVEEKNPRLVRWRDRRGLGYVIEATTQTAIYGLGSDVEAGFRLYVEDQDQGRADLGAFPTFQQAAHAAVADGAEGYGAATFAAQTLPGGTNYREFLVTLPETAGNEGNFTFLSSHWSEPNVVVHLRTTDRTLPDGREVLFVEEVQSDWHTAGLRRGYRPDNTAPVPLTRETLARVLDDYVNPPADHREQLVDALYEQSRLGPEAFGDSLVNDLGLEQDEADRIVESFRSGAIPSDAVPDAPFKRRYPELAMKVALMTAAQEGYDAVAWTDGRTQAMRGASTWAEIARVRAVSFVEPMSGETLWRVNAWDSRGERVEMHSWTRRFENLERRDMWTAVIPDAFFDKVVGRAAADHFRAREALETVPGLPREAPEFTVAPPHFASDRPGFQRLYDEQIPRFMAKTAARWRTAPETSSLSIRVDPEDASEVERLFSQVEYSGGPEVFERDISAHVLTITPEMRRDLTAEGLPLFSIGAPGLPFPEAFPVSLPDPGDDMIAHGWWWQNMGHGVVRAYPVNEFGDIDDAYLAARHEMEADLQLVAEDRFVGPIRVEGAIFAIVDGGVGRHTAEAGLSMPIAQSGAPLSFAPVISLHAAEPLVELDRQILSSHLRNGRLTDHEHDLLAHELGLAAPETGGPGEAGHGHRPDAASTGAHEGPQRGAASAGDRSQSGPRAGGLGRDAAVPERGQDLLTRLDAGDIVRRPLDIRTRDAWLARIGYQGTRDDFIPEALYSAPEPERRVISTGVRLRTAGGREMAPAPRIDGSTDRRLTATLKRMNAWLLDEARKEVAGDPWRTTLLEAVDPDNLSQSDQDTISLILFDDPLGATEANVIPDASAARQETLFSAPRYKTQEQAPGGAGPGHTSVAWDRMPGGRRRASGPSRIAWRFEWPRMDGFRQIAQRYVAHDIWSGREVALTPSSGGGWWAVDAAAPDITLFERPFRSLQLAQGAVTLALAGDRLPAYAVGRRAIQDNRIFSLGDKDMTNKTLFVELSNRGNPDFHQDPDSPLPDTRSDFKLRVRGLGHASETARRYIDAHDLGGGNWTGGRVTDQDGLEIAQVSYNGRVWEPGPYPQPEITSEHPLWSLDSGVTLEVEGRNATIKRLFAQPDQGDAGTWQATVAGAAYPAANIKTPEAAYRIAVMQARQAAAGMTKVPVEAGDTDAWFDAYVGAGRWNGFAVPAVERSEIERFMASDTFRDLGFAVGDHAPKDGNEVVWRFDGDTLVIHEGQWPEDPCSLTPGTYETADGAKTLYNLSALGWAFSETEEIAGRDGYDALVEEIPDAAAREALTAAGLDLEAWDRDLETAAAVESSAAAQVKSVLARVERLEQAAGDETAKYSVGELFDSEQAFGVRRLYGDVGSDPRAEFIAVPLTIPADREQWSSYADKDFLTRQVEVRQELQELADRVMGRDPIVTGHIVLPFYGPTEGHTFPDTAWSKPSAWFPAVSALADNPHAAYRRQALIAHIKEGNIERSELERLGVSDADLRRLDLGFPDLALADEYATWDNDADKPAADLFHRLEEGDMAREIKVSKNRSGFPFSMERLDIRYPKAYSAPEIEAMAQQPSSVAFEQGLENFFGPLEGEALDKIRAAVADPNQETWPAAARVIVTKSGMGGITLLQALQDVNPHFPRAPKLDGTGPVPSQMDLYRAVRHAASINAGLTARGERSGVSYKVDDAVTTHAPEAFIVFAEVAADVDPRRLADLVGAPPESSDLFHDRHGAAFRDADWTFTDRTMATDTFLALSRRPEVLRLRLNSFDGADTHTLQAVEAPEAPKFSIGRENDLSLFWERDGDVHRGRAAGAAVEIRPSGGLGAGWRVDTAHAGLAPVAALRFDDPDMAKRAVMRQMIHGGDEAAPGIDAYGRTGRGTQLAAAGGALALGAGAAAALALSQMPQFSIGGDEKAYRIEVERLPGRDAPKDPHAAGVYAMKGSFAGDDAARRSAALDHFRAAVPISALEAFDIAAREVALAELPHDARWLLARPRASGIAYSLGGPEDAVRSLGERYEKARRELIDALPHEIIQPALAAVGTGAGAGAIAREVLQSGLPVYSAGADGKGDYGALVRILAGHEDREVRAAAARHADMPEDMMRKLAQDEDWDVRATVAGRLDLPADLLPVLARDPDENVRAAVAVRDGLPADIIETLAADGNMEVRHSLAFLNYDLSPFVVARLAADESADVRHALTFRARLAEGVVERLAADDSPKVRKGVALRDALSDDVIRRLAADEDEAVRRTVAWRTGLSGELRAFHTEPANDVRYSTGEKAPMDGPRADSGAPADAPDRPGLLKGLVDVDNALFAAGMVAGAGGAYHALTQLPGMMFSTGAPDPTDRLPAAASASGRFLRDVERRLRDAGLPVHLVHQAADDNLSEEDDVLVIHEPTGAVLSHGFQMDDGSNGLNGTISLSWYDEDGVALGYPYVFNQLDELITETLPKLTEEVETMAEQTTEKQFSAGGAALAEAAENTRRLNAGAADLNADPDKAVLGDDFTLKVFDGGLGEAERLLKALGNGDLRKVAPANREALAKIGGVIREKGDIPSLLRARAALETGLSVQAIEARKRGLKREPVSYSLGDTSPDRVLGAADTVVDAYLEAVADHDAKELKGIEEDAPRLAAGRNLLFQALQSGSVAVGTADLAAYTRLVGEAVENAEMALAASGLNSFDHTDVEAVKAGLAAAVPADLLPPDLKPAAPQYSTGDPVEDNPPDGKPVDGFVRRMLKAGGYDSVGQMLAGQLLGLDSSESAATMHAEGLGMDARLGREGPTTPKPGSGRPGGVQYSIGADALEPGQIYRLAGEVDRQPHFVAPAGTVVTVTEAGPERVAARAHTPIAGAEEWDNQVHWYGDPTAGLDAAGDFLADARISHPMREVSQAVLDLKQKHGDHGHMPSADLTSWIERNVIEPSRAAASTESDPGARFLAQAYVKMWDEGQTPRGADLVDYFNTDMVAAATMVVDGLPAPSGARQSRPRAAYKATQGPQGAADRENAAPGPEKATAQAVAEQKAAALDPETKVLRVPAGRDNEAAARAILRGLGKTEFLAVEKATRQQLAKVGGVVRDKGAFATAVASKDELEAALKVHAVEKRKRGRRHEHVVSRHKGIYPRQAALR